MNQGVDHPDQELTVWLPPDGDSRLVRFQEAVALATGRSEAGVLPPHLPCGASRVPSGPLTLGSWAWEAGLPHLEAWDTWGLVGCFRFVLPGGPPWLDPDRERLPAPPSLVWNRGRLAVLRVHRSEDGVVLWSWESVSGWKSDRPKE